MRTGLLTALVLASLPAMALAQISAPSMVDEDLAQEDAPATASDADSRPAREPSTAASRSGVPHEPSPPNRATPESPAAPAGENASPANPGSERAAGGSAAAPTPNGAVTPPEELAKLQRPIEPVRTTYDAIRELWQARRAAAREQDLPRAGAARERMLAAMRELGIENLTAFAAAEVRDVERSLAARVPDDAVEHATFAVELAPALADAHFALARARLAREPSAIAAVAAELWAALAAALREPHTVRAFYGDLWGAALAALFAGAVLAVLILFARRLRLFLHDFHHLPLLRAGAPSQAAFLAIVLLALPIAFRLGPFAILAAAALAVWLHLSRAERWVVAAALLSIVALPVLASAAARLTAWNGTLAEEVFELEHGGAAGPKSAEALERATSEKLPAPVLSALGRHLKRRGDLAGALRLYESAAEADPRAGEIQVNIGNLHFLRGDLEGAKAAYLAATDRSAGSVTTLAAAHYNLSKLYLRLSALEQSQEARKKAQQEDRDFLERYGSDDDFRANRYLVDVPVPAERLEALAGAESARAVGEAVRARLAGPLPPPLWPAAPLLFVAALAGLGLVARRLEPARACERCGRPACRRCDGASGALCGQCVNVFLRKGLVDARDRLRKERLVRRRGQWVRFATRALAVVGGGVGHLYAGEAIRGFVFLLALLFVVFVVWFWRGLLPPPLPSPYAVAGKLLVAVPLGLAVYALTVRDAFRRSKG